ncbi:MAG: hypothetical protein DA407_11750 [Bacteroidetes bacterium]|nr:MAG: hypothetical protein DA407_11750 [Bacteroidota bacterium]
MKKTLLTLFLICFIGSLTFAQVTAEQVDDFEDGTTQGWIEGGASPNPPTNITTGGPSGANDNYLQDLSAGGGGAGSRMVFYNQSQWTGDYTTQSIVAIKFHVKVETNDLNIRVAFDGGGGRFCTTNSVNIIAGSGWSYVVVPILSSDFTAVGGSDINDTLADVNTMRILSSSTPSWVGESIVATLEVDNILAATTLSINENKKVDFSIYPNPSKSKLNINLAQNNNATKVEVFDILGKRIYLQSLTSINSTINASSWNSGVYLVKITSDIGTQTKRFVKQ